MAKYVALLRGIGPANPNMHGSKLQAVLESLGFANVRPVISSGNVVFESGQRSIRKLEDLIEPAWPRELGFTSTTIVRSRAQLQALVDADPYGGVDHSRKTYQLVTFFKRPPGEPPEHYYDVAGVDAACATIDTTASKTPDFMSRLERRYGREITSRTWLTIHRILGKMEP